LESLLLSISGRDQRGLLARLTEHLDRLGAQISDIGQAVIHDELALAMIIHTDQKKTLDQAIRDVCERLDVRFELSIA
jgi:phosphoserine phosphatase